MIDAEVPHNQQHSEELTDFKIESKHVKKSQSL